MSKKEESREEELSETMKIANLSMSSRGVNVVAKAVSKSAERAVTSQWDQTEHKVCEATVADDSGAITLVLWDDNVDKVNEGDVIEIQNGYIKVFKGSMQLNVGRYGSLAASDAEIESVNTENNLSQKEVPAQYGYRGGYGGGYGGGYRRGGYSGRYREREEKY
ncbi:MAG: OB-fold nucleic acid binding domain-containing protein [Aigarchaeota archaeon]|nr:OB-fold nucleic acid binding domain-containing protein [Aigarchaeota archaeon]